MHQLTIHQIVNNKNQFDPVCNNANRKLFMWLIQNISTNVPAMINNAPEADFKVTGSFRNIADKMMASATLSLSTGATCDTFPSCNALK